MPTPTIENYAKHILRLQEEAPDGIVALGHLADSLNVTAGTVTSMVKTLDEAGLVNYLPRRGVRLTDRGKTLALHVLRRHRILELYLVQRLGMDWAEVHDEAEVLEHVVSDKVLKRMESALGDTTLDPHGSPIPTRDGELHDLRVMHPLTDAGEGQEVTIARVRERDASFLDFLAKSGLTPGTEVRIQSVEPTAGIMRLKPLDLPEVTLSLAAAANVDVSL